MTRVSRSSLVAGLILLSWSPATLAQTAPSPPANTQSAAFTAYEDQRPATTTFLGDTGIWYVPTAEVLRSGTWSVGGDRRGTNYVQGSSNVADFAGSLAVGIGNRVEVFGAFLFDTRINRNDAPVFANEAREGGIAARYPRVNESWTGNKVGDLYVGSKVNLLSEYREAPMALAVRGIVKLPTGNEEAGVSTGKTDVMADLIVSKELARLLRGRHVRRATRSRQPGRHSRRRTARTDGAPASRFRRAARCGCPPKSTATCRRAIARR